MDIRNSQAELRFFLEIGYLQMEPKYTVTALMGLSKKHTYNTLK